MKPRVFASKCLGFAACRWDGTIIADEFVKRLRGRVEFITACPEAEIGLGIPRDPVRIVINSKGKRLVQLNTKRDVTKAMKRFVSSVVESIGDDMDGLILKDRSPSCGIRGVKAYASLRAKEASKRTTGFFGGEVARRFPGLPVEGETRLKDRDRRKRFLAAVFSRAAGRAAKKGAAG